MNERILITGGSGIIGGRLSALINSPILLKPSHMEMDLTSRACVRKYIYKTMPSVIIHAGAYINLFKTEKERGNTSGIAWKTNVEGTKYIVEAAKEVNAFVVYISTGSVFAGAAENPGPFTEINQPSHDNYLSWYGVTKKAGEALMNNGAIIRLSHPVGGRTDIAQKQDYLEKIIELYRRESLYPLFTDVLFPITYIPDLVLLLQYIMKKRATGAYHPVSRNFTSPVNIMKHLGFTNIQTIHFSEFLSTQKYPLMFSQYYALDGKKTCLDTGIPERTWQEIVTLAFQDTTRSLQ